MYVRSSNGVGGCGIILIKYMRKLRHRDNNLPKVE